MKNLPLNRLCRYCTGRLSGFFILVTLLVSCDKDELDHLKSVTWEPELAIPVAYAEIGIDDLAHVNDTSIQIVVDQDQFCTLVYSGRLFELKGSELMNTPDQTLVQQVRLNNSQILTLGGAGQVLVAGQQPLVFSPPQGAEVDTIYLSAGNLTLAFDSQMPLDADIRITIPGMDQNGIIFSTQVPLDYNGTLPVTAQVTLPLTGYRMNLTNGGAGHNTMQIQYAITFTGNASQVTTSDYIDLHTGFTGLNYSMAYGYAGQQSIMSSPDTVPVSIFHNAPGTGSFRVLNPSITCTVGNNMGIPFDAHVPGLAGMNHDMTVVTPCTGIPDPLPVPTPTLMQAGQTLQSTFVMDHTNSNVQALIQGQPAFLVATTQAGTNPAGRSVNFIPGNGALTLDMVLSLPLYGTASDFRLRDTMPFSYNDLDKAESVTIRLGVENWFPIEARAKLIFLDARSEPLDSLYFNGASLIPPGKISGASGRVKIPGRRVAEEIFNSSRTAKIRTVTSIIVEAEATTTNNGQTPVRIYHDYKMKLSVGAVVKLRVE